ncbi:MAG: hypothetical protein MJB14_06355 [Spirochaetes bacterium]|nr:hypothetical protein [Spirochaetota bacterium]
MGAEPYHYLVDYEDNLQSSLDKLRQQVFDSGEFFGVELNPKIPDEALRFTEPEGTQTILDIQKIANHPDYYSAAPFTKKELIDFFGTDQPTEEMIETNDRFWDFLERGMARYIIVYKDDKPDKIFFAGYSFD